MNCKFIQYLFVKDIFLGILLSKTAYMKKYYNVISTVILCTVISFAQQKPEGEFTSGSIAGKVLDLSTRHVIEYANILVMSELDSSMVVGGVSDSRGNFNLKIPNTGNFYVEVKFIGYETERITITLTPEKLNVDLGEILIKPSSILLENVVVEGQRAPVTYEIDKKIINPNQMLNVVSGNAADVLSNVPSVHVDIEGNVSVRGSQSFSVLIDGRPSVLDPQEALQQIQASSIDRIELITNPSAKYDPEGTAGIINIILKKNTSKGFNGFVNADAGMHDTYGADFLLNYQANNIKTNFSLDYSRRFYPGDLTQNNISYLDNNISTTNSVGGVTRGRIGYEGRGGIEFTLNENNSLSFGVRAGRREGQYKTNQIFTQISEQDPSEITFTGNTDRSRAGPYYALNSNYTHIFGPNGHQLLGELYYGHRSSDEITTTSEFDGDVQVSGKKTTEIGPSTDFRGKLDYTLPFSELSKFEAGYQGQVDLDEETNELYEYTESSGDYEFLPAFSNLNKYTRSEHAFYSMYSSLLWEIQYQVGLRGEYTYRTIEVPTQNEYFDLDRFDYFPSFHTSYKFSESSSVMASYSRKIDRPGGWALEPFDTWIDANNVRRGNPNLQPEFIDSYETGIQSLLGSTNFSTEIYYRITHNKIERVQTALDENVILTTRENVGTDYSLGGEAMFNFDPVQFWNVNFMGNIYHYLVEGVLYDESFSNSSFNWQIRFYNNFKLWSSTQIQFNLNYNSKTVSAQGTLAGNLRTDLSVRQDIIKNILSATVQIRDLLGTAKREFTSEGYNFYNSYNYNYNTPTIVLNLRYTFNNYKPKEERGDGSEGLGGGEDF